MSQQYACFTFIHFEGQNKKWALKQMFKARGPLEAWSSLRFHKLVGLGGGHGYSLKTRFDAYGIFTVWDHATDAEEFYNSSFFGEFAEKSKEYFTVVMKPLSSRGSWSGFNDWKPSPMDSSNQMVCVLTRATLKVRFIYPFFRMIQRVMKDHYQFPGLVFSRGFSELPLKEQATFSIWENVEQMKKFAYNSFHALAIKITRRKKGFKEDMYTRFQPIATVGTWKGINPLKGKVEHFDKFRLVTLPLAG